VRRRSPTEAVGGGRKGQKKHRKEMIKNTENDPSNTYKMMKWTLTLKTTTTFSGRD